MGALAILSEINPLTALANTVKAVAHDCSVYVCNAASLDSDCCSCWRFNVQTFETGEPEQSEHSINVAWN